MSQSTLSEVQPSGTIDAPTSTEPTDRSLVIDAATTALALDSFETFRTTAELTEDTIQRLAP